MVLCFDAVAMELLVMLCFDSSWRSFSVFFLPDLDSFSLDERCFFSLFSFFLELLEEFFSLVKFSSGASRALATIEGAMEISRQGFFGFTHRECLID